MNRRSFLGLGTLGGVGLVLCWPGKWVSKISHTIKYRKRYGARQWAAAQGGFIARIEIIDCRNPDNPVQFRQGVVCEKGLLAIDAQERLTKLGRSAGRLVSYRTGHYTNLPGTDELDNTARV